MSINHSYDQYMYNQHICATDIINTFVQPTGTMCIHGITVVWCSIPLGPTAEKLCELPDNSSPIEVIVLFIVRRAISASLELDLVVGALERLMEGVSVCASVVFCW